MNKNKAIWFVVSLLLVISSCKDDFLVEKRDLNGVNEDVFKDPLLAKGYVDYMYFSFQPADNAQAFTWELSANGDAWSRTTEEFGGQTDWNRDWPVISYNQNHAPKYFGAKLPTGGPANTPYTRIRQINIFLEEIDKYGLPDATKKELKGQMLFWRAYQYFDLVRLYGGVPLVLSSQNAVLESGPEIEVPRSKTSEVFEQVIKDLDAAVTMLPGKWPSSEWGRITSGAAAAFKGRVLLTWASPQFNRTDERARWQRAYDANLAAKTLLEANGFALFKEGTLANGDAWEKMWFKEANNPEAVIVTGFNKVNSDQVQKNNGWEQAARPRDIAGSSSLSPTKQIMDAFPMKDGEMPGASSYTYDAKKFYKNRDPRFSKTFAYNGSLWNYDNKAYRLWTYSWFSASSKTTPDKTTETKGANSSGIYLKKATNPAASNSSGDFAYSGTDYIELRFAEVLLNLAESAIGIDKYSEAKALIGSVRERAGVESKDGAWGLADVNGRDPLFAAVLNERKIELAFEGKRFWDLRRWMLFDNQFGTVARLGLTPLNGTRRTGIWIYVKKADGTKYFGNPDPMIRVGATAPVIDREPLTFPAGITTYDQYLDYLYDNHFEVIEKDNLDPTTANWKFKWYPEYYFFGLHKTILDVSPYLEQTQGWESPKGAGTFDPLK
jgi:starch-binding outer membrane protein, SusD/RagB family